MCTMVTQPLPLSACFLIHQMGGGSPREECIQQAVALVLQNAGGTHSETEREVRAAEGGPRRRAWRVPPASSFCEMNAVSSPASQKSEAPKDSRGSRPAVPPSAAPASFPSPPLPLLLPPPDLPFHLLPSPTEEAAPVDRPDRDEPEQ